MFMMLAVTPTSHYLRFQADRIERVLAAHALPARVQESALAPRWIRFLLNLPFTAKLTRAPNLSGELAQALGAEDVRVDRAGEALTVAMRRPDVDPVRLLSLLETAGSLPPLTACLGQTEDETPLLLRLPAADVQNVFVAGASGVGKTELMRSMIVSLALRNRQARLQVALIDLQSRGFAPLAGLPHLLADVASDAASALAILDRVLWEMDRRYDGGVLEPHILLAIDEMLDLLAAGDEGMAAALTELAERGPMVGVHVLAGSREPAAALGALGPARFPVRLVGRVTTPDEAHAAAGQTGSGAESLTGPGEFVCVAGGQVIPFQAAWLSAKDWAQAAAGLWHAPEMDGR